MNLVVNELSFVEKADCTFYSASALLEPLIKTVLAFRKLPHARRIFTHSTFCSVTLGNQWTILKCAYAVRRNENWSLFLQLITKGPYIDDLLGKEAGNHSCSLAGQDVRSSSLAGAAFLDADVASAAGVAAFAGDTITVNFSRDASPPTSITLVNFIQEAALHQKYVRIYRPSKKHMPGGAGTLMTLDDQTASQVLNSGVLAPNRRQVYGIHGDICFEFQREDEGVFHGYPVPGRQVPSETLRAMVRAGMLSISRYRELLKEGG